MGTLERVKYIETNFTGRCKFENEYLSLCWVDSSICDNKISIPECVQGTIVFVKRSFGSDIIPLVVNNTRRKTDDNGDILINPKSAKELGLNADGDIVFIYSKLRKECNNEGN